MGIPDMNFDHLLKRISDNDKKSLFDYMEYLASRSVKRVWDAIPEVDEPLNEEESRLLASGERKETTTLEELRRGLNL